MSNRGPSAYDRHRASRALDLESYCRMPDRYYVVSSAKLARDLRDRTVKQIFAENAAGRRADLRMPPAVVDGETYMTHMRKLRGKKWQPHPASIDPNHKIAQQRLGVGHVQRSGA